MKTAEEILENYEGKSPSSDGHGWVDMDSGGSWYYEDNVLSAMTEYANQDKWISVEDSLPKENIDVLVHDATCLQYIATYTGEDYIFYCEDMQEFIKTITHWQPLPNPPTK